MKSFNCLFYTINYISRGVLFCNNQRDINHRELRDRTENVDNRLSILKELIDISNPNSQKINVKLKGTRNSRVCIEV